MPAFLQPSLRMLRWLWSECDTQPICVMAAGAALGWGLALLLHPMGLNERYYSQLAYWAPRQVWIAVFLSLATLKAVALLWLSPRHWKWHVAITGYSFAVWTLVCTSYVFSGAAGLPGPTVYYVIWFGTLWTFIRAGTEVNPLISRSG